MNEELLARLAKIIDNAPLVPYAGSSGWSGSEASKDRADKEDNNGTTGTRQVTAYLDVSYSETRGITWVELANLNGWHHGQASGVLSVLHKEGKITRLKLRRDKSSVYVLQENINNREVNERKIKTCGNCGHKL